MKIAANDMYGGTFRLFSKIFEKTGIHFHYVNMQNPKIFVRSSTKNKIIWAETPTNPLMNIVDLAAVASLQRKNILFCRQYVCIPYLQTRLISVPIL
jgi:cystathionine beta-lyase/cystathionine gamma-synthase